MDGRPAVHLGGFDGLWVSAKRAVDNDFVQSALEERELVIIELGNE